MKKLVAGLGVVILAVGVTSAAAAERWLHVSIEDGSGAKAGERVRVNLPLSVAEKVLPAVQVDRFKHGKVKLEECEMNGTDLRAVLEAVKDARDGEFVTVEGTDGNVRVSKSKGYLVAKVTEGKGNHARVDVRLPMVVLEALLSGAKDELDLTAGIRALAAHGDTVLVTVKDEDSFIRVWVDSKNEASRELD